MYARKDAIQHMLKGDAELNEGNASLLKEADRLLEEAKEARERARVLAEDKEAMVAKLRSPRAGMIFSRRRRRSRMRSFAYSMKTRRNSRLIYRLSSGEGGVEERSFETGNSRCGGGEIWSND